MFEFKFHIVDGLKSIPTATYQFYKREALIIFLLYLSIERPLDYKALYAKASVTRRPLSLWRIFLSAPNMHPIVLRKF
jgi:hypothetical protein